MAISHLVNLSLNSFLLQSWNEKGPKGLYRSGIRTWWCVGHIILVDQLDCVKTQLIFSLDGAVGPQYWNTDTLYPFSVHRHLVLWELACIGAHEIVERNLWKKIFKMWCKLEEREIRDRLLTKRSSHVLFFFRKNNRCCHRSVLKAPSVWMLT